MLNKRHSLKNKPKTNMIKNRIESIEAKLKSADHIPETTRRELLGLLASLKLEIAPLSDTQSEDAHSIAGFVDASAHEATRTEKKPELLSPALSGLRASVQEFESSHPGLVSVVNRLAFSLSNMGI